jgi:hypothetical protein
VESKKEKTKFLNPFGVGVSYKDFLASIPKGVTLEDYCKSELTKEQINYLKTELENYKKN